MEQDRQLRRLGVLGGTFDPLHIGHLVAASEALHAWGLDQVLFVPAGAPWQKRSFSDPEDRLLMTSLGVAGHRSFAVSRLEIDRKGPTYTADTLESLRGFHGDDVALFFLAGADAVAGLRTWKHLDRIAEVAEIVAVPRPGSALVVESAPDLPVVHVLEMPAIEVSATAIRQRVRAGAPIDFLVPAPVATYIRANGLYLADPEAADAS